MPALSASGLAEDTIVVLTSDHGEMLGERGLWYKMNFFEGASRVPLVVASPGRFAPAARRGQRVARRSAADAHRSCRRRRGGACGSHRRAEPWPHLAGRAGHDEAIGEYLAEGAVAPLVMIRRGAFKFIHCPADPDQLYDLGPIRASATIWRGRRPTPTGSPRSATRSQSAGIWRRLMRKSAKASAAAGWSTRLSPRARSAPGTSSPSANGASDILAGGVAKRARITNDRQGIYIYREQRLIHDADWLGMFQKEPHFSLIRVEFSFDHRLDDAFYVDIKKSRILLGPVFS